MAGIFDLFSSYLGDVFQRLENATREGKTAAEVAGNVMVVVKRAREALERREVSASAQRARGKSFYDSLQIKILEIVRTGRSREDLLRELTATLADGSQDQRSALGYLVIEARPIQCGEWDAEIIRHTGFNESRFQNYITNSAYIWKRSPILTKLIADREEFDFIYTGYMDKDAYHGEFAGLSDGRKDVWFAAVPLPSLDRSLPDRALIGLYPAAGRREMPDLPRGARHEWWTLQFAQHAYNLLNHQLAGRAEQVAAQRRNLIADLAPGAINHEIRHQMETISTHLTLILNHAEQLAARYDADADVAALFEPLSNSFLALGRAFRITHAFNTIEKRKAQTVISVRDLLSEPFVLLEYRMVNLAVDFILSDEHGDLMLCTDAPLVEHVLLNLVVNALDAIEIEQMPTRETQDAQRKPALFGKRRRAKIEIVIERDLEEISFIVSNDGPPIPERDRTRIFEKGVTSKPSGHGHGLYICRLIASYLGGQIKLVESRRPGFNVSFTFTIPIEARTREDLGAIRAENLR